MIAHNSVGVIAVRALQADSDATTEVGVLFTALRDYVGKLRAHGQHLRRRFVTAQVAPLSG